MVMLKNSEGRCASTKAAASPQRPWRKFIRGLILPKQSSRGIERCQRLFIRNQPGYSSQEEEEEGSNSNSEVSSTCNDVPFRINERLRCIGCNKRRPSFSDTESVLDIVKMPVGTTNPVLKSSFSLTSLRSSTPTYSPEHGAPLRLKTERAYHSLTKKSRQSGEQDKEQWRKSWGSGISQDGKEFWEVFQADYDYLMAQNILDREASDVPPENGIPRAPPVWSHSEFMDHFAQLYSWLRGIQDSVYGKEENVTDWKLRAERLEDMQRQRFRLDNFKEESKNLIARYPNSEGEVTWWVKHISDKWETVEAIMGGYQKCEGEKGSEEKIKHEIKCLRKWLKELDSKLKPLSFQRSWTKAELEAKSKELMVLHRDLESQKKIFSSVQKLCEKVKFPRLKAVLGALERKFHLHYLRFLEWKYYIESLIGQQFKAFSNVSNESDGEPVLKIARFARWNGSEARNEAEDKGASDGLKSDEEFSKDDNWQMEAPVDRKDAASPTGEVPPDAMVGARVERSDGLGGSASMVGSNSNNANISFSCANHGTDSRLKSAGNSSDGGHENCLRNINTAPEPGTNRLKERPPNTGSFSWKHLDTDSEQEKAMSEGESKGKKDSKECLNGKDVETTSSEGGWIYKSATPTEKSEAGVEKKPKAAVRLDFKEDDPKQLRYISAKNIPSMPNGKESISSRKLVELADELVRCKSGKAWKTRRERSKRGSIEKVLESYDASGEYTDSDECQKLEDREGSFASCRRFGSADGILDGKVPFEFAPRRPRHPLRNRPLSMSSVSWLRTPRNQSLRSQASMSESALNQIIELEMCFSTPGRGGRTVGGEEGSGGSSRRRKTKIRKQMSKKSDSGSEGLTLSGNDSPNASPSGRHLSALVKSGSFSGVTRKQRELCGFDSMTGTETEEETYRLMPPAFRFGPSAGAVTVTVEQDKTQAEEQLSLNWDSFQEKYQSEACSEEPADSDTAKKLLEFGEDYGKFLGNQSDCASIRSCSFAGRSRSKIDSESDVDEVRQTLRHSLEQLNLWEIKFNETFGGFSAPNDFTSDGSKMFLDEILGVCKRNVECLAKLLFEVKDEMLLAKEHNYILRLPTSHFHTLKECDQLANGIANKRKSLELGFLFSYNCESETASDAMTSLLSSFGVQPKHLNAANMVSVQVQTDYVKESWENLKATAELHKAKQLKREMLLLKEELLCLGPKVDSIDTPVTSREELEAKITQIQNELNLMKNGKSRLLQANVSVHRFLASAKNSDAALRDEVTELYQLWDQTFRKISSQLSNFQSLSQTWLDFEDHLAQLQCALRTDTLKVLDFALKSGSPSRVSLSFQDIAGILSDKESAASKDSPSAGETPESAKPTIPVLAALSTEGSLSDSGISDSGSEQELSEREKRLAQLKRLAKRLESILAPGSQALSNMFKRIEQAESELRELQKTCRDLIVRSASTEEIRVIVANAASLGNLELDGDPSAPGPPQPGRRTKGPESAGEADPPSELLRTGGEEAEDCDGGKPGKKFWFWRLLRYAFPFQLALVALLCIASIMEPRCCDSLNNFDLSLNPQLRYDSGPPPV